MKNKYTHGIVAISLLLMLSGCNFMQSTDTGSGAENNAGQNAETTSEAQSREAADGFYGDAVEKGDAAACNGIENEALKNDCRYDAALKSAVTKKDAKECNVLSAKDLVDQCKKEAADIQGPPNA